MPVLSRPQFAGCALLVVFVLVLGGRWLASRPPAEPSPPSSPTAGEGEGRAGGVVVRAPRRAVVVHVAGAVARPGVYRLRAGARIEEAVRRAGGAARGADVNGLNLAAPVEDGVRVVVPTRAPASASGAAATREGAEPAPVDLNAATAEQLDGLDGVGPATAAKILDYRRRHGGFRSVDDLGQIPGIGPKKLAALRPRVRT